MESEDRGRSEAEETRRSWRCERWEASCLKWKKKEKDEARGEDEVWQTSSLVFEIYILSTRIAFPEFSISSSPILTPKPKTVVLGIVGEAYGRDDGAAVERMIWQIKWLPNSATNANSPSGHGEIETPTGWLNRELVPIPFVAPAEKATPDKVETVPIDFSSPLRCREEDAETSEDRSWSEESAKNLCFLDQERIVGDQLDWLGSQVRGHSVERCECGNRKDSWLSMARVCCDVHDRPAHQRKQLWP
jgi:hypothetical protein